MPKGGCGNKASRCCFARILSHSWVTDSSGVSSPEWGFCAFNNLQPISPPWACPWTTCRLLAFTVSFGKELYCSTIFWAQANLPALDFEPVSLPLVSFDEHQYGKGQWTTYIAFATLLYSPLPHCPSVVPCKINNINKCTKAFKFTRL